MAKPIKKSAKKARKQVSQEQKEGTARDSYTMPQDEHKYLDIIQKKCLQESVYVKKSEILRVGLMAIRDMPISRFLKLWENLTKLSPGRPRKIDE